MDHELPTRVHGAFSEGWWTAGNMARTVGYRAGGVPTARVAQLVRARQRTALQVMFNFLDMNGFTIRTDEADVVRTMLASADGAVSEVGPGRVGPRLSHSPRRRARRLHTASAPLRGITATPSPLA